MSITEEVNNQLYSLKNENYSEATLRRAQKILTMAETTGDLELIFRAQKKVMNHAAFTSQVEILLNAFTWCRAKVDEHPGKFPFNINWEYKWVIIDVLDFPQISLQQAEEMIEDLKKRSNATEESRSIAKLRMLIARITNDKDKLPIAYDNFIKAHDDSNSDCAACVLDSELDVLIDLKRYEEAREKIKPILNGRLSCDYVPRATYGETLEIYRGYDPELAWKHHIKGYRLVKKDALSLITSHISFAYSMGKFSRAMDIFQKQISKYKKATPLDRADFSLTCTELFSRILKSGKDEISLKMPDNFENTKLENGKYSASALRDFFESDCRKLAEQFDRRNGNSWYMDELAKAVK